MNKKRISNPGPRDLYINDSKEKALQRAMLKQTIDGIKTMLPNGDSVEWLDYELPVIFSDRSRRKSIDLIGRDNKGHLVLCEVKHSCNKKDSPHDAEIEVLTYLGEITLHVQELDDNSIHRQFVYIKDKANRYDLLSFKWRDFVTLNPRVFIMADKEYWNYWKGRMERQKKGVKDKKVIPVSDSSIECYSMDIEDNYFEKQLESSDDTMFTPGLDKNEWTLITFD